MEIKWHGHSWFRVAVDGVRLDFDPLSEKYCKRFDPTAGDDLGPPADFVLVSHSHGDHWDKETIGRLKGPNTVIIAHRKPANRLGSRVKVIEASSASSGEGSLACSSYWAAYLGHLNTGQMMAPWSRSRERMDALRKWWVVRRIDSVSASSASAVYYTPLRIERP